MPRHCAWRLARRHRRAPCPSGGLWHFGSRTPLTSTWLTARWPTSSALVGDVAPVRGEWTDAGCLLAAPDRDGTASAVCAATARVGPSSLWTCACVRCTGPARPRRAGRPNFPGVASLRAPSGADGRPRPRYAHCPCGACVGHRCATTRRPSRTHAAHAAQVGPQLACPRSARVVRRRAPVPHRPAVARCSRRDAPRVSFARPTRGQRGDGPWHHPPRTARLPGRFVHTPVPTRAPPHTLGPECADALLHTVTAPPGVLQRVRSAVAVFSDPTIATWDAAHVFGATIRVVSRFDPAPASCWSAAPWSSGTWPRSLPRHGRRAHLRPATGLGRVVGESRPLVDRPHHRLRWPHRPLGHLLRSPRLSRQGAC